ncbi:hypothetical protein B0H13DRAFT_1914890 [Mycena leptocephala]|nr:hypothetical protein B0H13DRAFT_1914890 [Mycena leptocephala]
MSLVCVCSKLWTFRGGDASPACATASSISPYEYEYEYEDSMNRCLTYPESESQCEDVEITFGAPAAPCFVIIGGATVEGRELELGLDGGDASGQVSRATGHRLQYNFDAIRSSDEDEDEDEDYDGWMEY